MEEKIKKINPTLHRYLFIVTTLIATLTLLGSFAFSVPKVLATTGGGTATIAVDGGTSGANVTVAQSTSHTFTAVLTIPGAGMTLGAASPTFTIPTGFTAPTLHAVANSGLVDADGKWSVAASGGSCAVDSSPVSSTTVASGQVITVDITANCASGNTITLTYKGTSATAMGATALTISTADAGDPGPVTPLIAGSPTITVTASATPTPSPSSPTVTASATPTPSPSSPTVTASATPTPSPSSSSTGSSSGSSSAGGGASTCTASVITTVPIILESRRVSPTSIFISWGPYAGLNTFNVRYGTTNGVWLYNYNFTGFSATINNLPPNQPFWFQVAARNNCFLGTYGAAKFVGGPGLPNTGFGPDNNIPWYIISAGFILFPLFLLRLKRI